METCAGLERLLFVGDAIVQTPAVFHSRLHCELGQRGENQ